MTAGIVQNIANHEAPRAVSGRSRPARRRRSATIGPPRAPGGAGPVSYSLETFGRTPPRGGRLRPRAATPARKPRCGMYARTATRLLGLSSLLPAPRTFPSRTRSRPWRCSVSATSCGSRRGVPPGNPNTSAPASPPLIVWSDLGLIIRRRPPSPAPRRFSATRYQAPAGAWPDPRGIISSTSMWRGGSLAPSGVAAAHAASCGARGARFCKPPRAGCAALGVAPFQVSGYAEPGRIEYIGAA